VKSLRTRWRADTRGCHTVVWSRCVLFLCSGKQELEFSWCSGEKASSDLAVVGGFR